MSTPKHLNGRLGLISAHKRAFIIHPFLPCSEERHHGERSDEIRLKESVALAQACGLDPRGAETIILKKPHPGLFFGTGFVETLHQKMRDLDATILVMGCNLSPIQHRNLEKKLEACVIDRTRLILEIFSRRAKTHEGRLQVDLAALSWQKSRLVKSWDHLERQRGGSGFLSGPGERQLEIDRRLLHQRIIRLKNALVDVKKTRSLQRKNRPYPLIALIGYTNAGKSTLFSCLTKHPTRGKSQLFASLDTSLKAVTLPTGRNVLFADTVGFVSDLPPSLVEAFHATLEELCYADIILHIRDISAPDSQAQQQDVLHVIHAILSKENTTPTIIEIWNKTDRLDKKHFQALENLVHTQDCLLVSALNNQGIDSLKQKIDTHFLAQEKLYEIILFHQDDKARAFLYAHGIVKKTDWREQHYHMQVYLSRKEAGRFSHQFKISLNDFEGLVSPNSSAQNKKSKQPLPLPQYWQPIQ